MPGVGGASVLDPSSSAPTPEILPGGIAEPYAAPGTGGPAMSAAVPQRQRKIHGYSGFTVDPMTDKPKAGLNFVLDVDHIVAESRIRLYLSLEYPELSPKLRF
jgi:hypothetical protein